jgi:hypothetical protein
VSWFQDEYKIDLPDEQAVKIEVCPFLCLPPMICCPFSDIF